MKKLINLFFIATLFLIGFTACEQTDEPGGIPGMGDTPGELEIAEPFVAPEGLSIEVSGLDELTLEDGAGIAQLKSTQSRCSIHGVGGSRYKNRFKVWIRTNIWISNISNKKICTTLRRGLIFKVSKEGYQHGILVKPVKICINPNTEQNIELWLMCINKGKDGSKHKLKYHIAGITASKVINNLLNYLKGKKIDVSDYCNVNPSAKLKSTTADDMVEYQEIADHIQNAIWQLTNEGKDLSQEQIDYFNSLPDDVEE